MKLVKDILLLFERVKASYQVGSLKASTYSICRESCVCVCVFLRAGRRGLAKAAFLLSLELSLSVRVSFVHAVGDKPPDAGM